MENTKRIVVADTGMEFRKNLIRALSEEPDFQIVGETGDGSELMRMRGDPAGLGHKKVRPLGRRRVHHAALDIAGQNQHLGPLRQLRHSPHQGVPVSAGGHYHRRE